MPWQRVVVAVLAVVVVHPMQRHVVVAPTVAVAGLIVVGMPVVAVIAAVADRTVAVNAVNC
jgi:hypothetical protein